MTGHREDMLEASGNGTTTQLLETWRGHLSCNELPPNVAAYDDRFLFLRLSVSLRPPYRPNVGTVIRECQTPGWLRSLRTSSERLSTETPSVSQGQMRVFPSPDCHDDRVQHLTTSAGYGPGRASESSVAGSLAGESQGAVLRWCLTSPTPT